MPVSVNQGERGSHLVTGGEGVPVCMITAWSQGWECGLAYESHIAMILVRPTGFLFSSVCLADEVEDAGSYWSAQRVWREVFFFNGLPNGPGKFGFQWFAQRVWRGFVFQWSAQRVWGGFVFQWSAQRGGIRFFNGLPNGSGGVSFFNGLPNGPGGFGFFFQWSAQRVWSFFNGVPNGVRGFGFFFNGLPNGPGGIRISMVRPTCWFSRAPQTLTQGHFTVLRHKML